MERTIPKIIHYCWFGKEEIPQKILLHMKTWNVKMPDYQIMMWNEDNFNIAKSNVYVQEAYKAKKYAFVSDYVRLWALREYGGVYLDTDVEVLKSPDQLLQKASMVIGFETSSLLLTAFIACISHHQVIDEMIAQYESSHFLLEDEAYDLTTINARFTDLMYHHGLELNNARQTLDNGVEVYPYDYFCGQDVENTHTKITDNTYTVHCFRGSWMPENRKLGNRFKYHLLIPMIQMVLGYERYDSLKRYLKL